MDDDGRALGDGGHARAGGGAGRAQIDGGFRRRIVREAIRDAAGFGRVCRHLLGVLLEDIADLPVIGDAEEIAVPCLEISEGSMDSKNILAEI